MLAEELPERQVRPRPQHPRVAALARTAQPRGRASSPCRCWETPADAPPPYRSAEPGQNEGVPLYRDEAIVLRTHKLGEADRIITLLTRSTGGCARSPRAYAGPRRSSAPGSSRSPTSTSSSPRGATSTRSPRPRPTTRSPPQLGADYERYTAGTVMLETAERLVTEEKEPSIQQFLLLVGGLRAMVGGERRPRPGARLLPAPLAGGGRLRAVVRRTAPAAALRGAAPLVQPVVRRDALRHLPGARARPARRRRRSPCSARCWPATGRSSRPPTRATSRRPAAWSRRSWPGTWSAALRSLAYVER